MENKINRLFASQLWVPTLGVDVPYPAVRDHHVPAIQVVWRPPAGGDARMAEILAKLRNL